MRGNHASPIANIWKNRKSQFINIVAVFSATHRHDSVALHISDTSIPRIHLRGFRSIFSKFHSVCFLRYALLQNLMPLTQTVVGNLTPTNLQRSCLCDRTFLFYEYNPFLNREQNDSKICNQQCVILLRSVCLIHALTNICYYIHRP